MVNLKLTNKDVEYLMKLAKNENFAIKKNGRKEKMDLWILMNLMYYCHLTMKIALSLSPNQLNYKDAYGTYLYEKKGVERKHMLFEIPEFLAYILEDYVKQNHTKPQEPIIKKKKRALQIAFQQICKEAGFEETRLIDVKYAGDFYYIETRRPYEMDYYRIE